MLISQTNLRELRSTLIKGRVFRSREEFCQFVGYITLRDCPREKKKKMKRAKKKSPTDITAKKSKAPEVGEIIQKPNDKECSELTPSEKIFEGIGFYFIPGSKFSVPVKKLKDAVLAQGAVIRTSISGATYMVATQEKIDSGFAGNNDLNHDQCALWVVNENYIAECVKCSKKLPVDDFVVNSTKKE